MTMLNPKKTLEVAGVMVGVTGLLVAGAVACNVDVISGDDGEGGQGGATTSTSVATTTGNAVTSVGSTSSPSVNASTSAANPVGSTAGSGMCPPDPQWPGDCSVGSTAAGGTEKFCRWQQGDCPEGDGFKIECDGATGFCTCTGGDDSCLCNWNVPSEIGQCGTPCCGGNPGL